MLILLCDKFEKSLPGKLVKFGEVSDDMKRLGEAEILLVRSKPEVNREFLSKAPNVKLVIRGGVGLDNIDTTVTQERSIQVLNTPEASTIAVAELAFAMMIAVPCHIVDAQNSMRDGKWLKKELERSELYGKTLGIIGVGRIGRELARRAVVFGMKVVAYDVVPVKGDDFTQLPTAEDVYKVADYISLHSPLTDATKEMMNKAAIAKMKKGVVIINTARGKLIHESDMAEALKSGQVATYAADVFGEEPLKKESPLLTAPNVLMAPHLGASTQENSVRIGEQIEKQISKYFSERKWEPMRPKVHNFNPGPAVLPELVLRKAQNEFLNFSATGMSIVEVSHRSTEYEAVHRQAMDKLRKILNLGNAYKIIFLGGGASLQFGMIPMNFLTPDKSADYIVTGEWADKATKEAKLFGKVNVTQIEKSPFTRIPKQNELKLDPKAEYVHMTTNNTIYGTQYHYFPDTGNVPLVADMSSDMLSRKFDANKFAFIYAGAQKNLGPAGVTLVIVREDFLKKANANLTTMLKYDTHTKNDSLYNTPPCFAIYTMNLVFDWILEKGGLEGIERRNQEKGDLLYGTLDSLANFYKCPVEKESRSLMNVVFRLPNEQLEEQFVKEGKSAGFIGLKGHRSVGGIRVSMYNACEPDSIRELVAFMKAFAQKHG